MSNTARDYQKQLVHYMRKSISYEDNGNELNVGIMPAGALMLKPTSGVAVTTAFNASAGNVLQIGTDIDPNYFATSLALGTAGFVPVDLASGVYLVAAATKVTATVELTGTAATAGAGEVIITYIPDNDG